MTNIRCNTDEVKTGGTIQYLKSVILLQLISLFHSAAYANNLVYTEHCSCSIYGDPVMIAFDGTRKVLLEPKQYIVTSYQDGPRGDLMLVYAYMEQTSDRRFPGNLDIAKVTVLYGSEFIVMDADKVTVNSRFATALPYTDSGNRYNITSQQRLGNDEDRYGRLIRPNVSGVGEKVNTFIFQTSSGIQLTISLRKNTDKLLLIIPRELKPKDRPSGLCGICS